MLPAQHTVLLCAGGGATDAWAAGAGSGSRQHLPPAVLRCADEELLQRCKSWTIVGKDLIKEVRLAV